LLSPPTPQLVLKRRCLVTPHHIHRCPSLIAVCCRLQKKWVFCCRKGRNNTTLTTSPFIRLLQVGVHSTPFDKGGIMDWAWRVDDTINNPSVNGKDKKVSNEMTRLPSIVEHALFVHFITLFKLQFQSIRKAAHIEQRIISINHNPLAGCNFIIRRHFDQTFACVPVKPNHPCRACCGPLKRHQVNTKPRHVFASTILRTPQLFFRALKVDPSCAPVQGVHLSNKG